MIERDDNECKLVVAVKEISPTGNGEEGDDECKKAQGKMISEWIAQNDSNYSKDNQLIHLHYKMRCDETADLFKETNGGNSSSECNIIVSISFFSLNQIQQVSQHQHCDCCWWIGSILIPTPHSCSYQTNWTDCYCSPSPLNTHSVCLNHHLYI